MEDTDIELAQSIENGDGGICTMGIEHIEEDDTTVPYMVIDTGNPDIKQYIRMDQIPEMIEVLQAIYDEWAVESEEDDNDELNGY